jgi:hypothetical protein
MRYDVGRLIAHHASRTDRFGLSVHRISDGNRTGADKKARKQPAQRAAKVEPKQTASAKVEPKPIEPQAAEPEIILDEAAEAERRVERFLSRAQEAIRGARLDDLSGLTITREMIEATFGVLTAWGDIIRGMYDAPAMQDYEAAPVAAPATNGSCGNLGAVEIAPVAAAGGEASA